MKSHVLRVKDGTYESYMYMNPMLGCLFMSKSLHFVFPYMLQVSRPRYQIVAVAGMESMVRSSHQMLLKANWFLGTNSNSEQWLQSDGLAIASSL